MTTILKTKLYIPRPGPNQVPRPRLVARLEGGLHARLTLISAPAGYGKTTLLSEWIAGRSSRFAWVSLDAADNDPARFLTYLISAMESIHKDLGAALLASIQNNQPLASDALLTGLINEIAEIPEPFVIILDDYHAIENAQVSEMLAFVLDNMPANLRLVIASRSDPALPLARLRARGQLIELRAADLRFTSSEVEAVLNEKLELDLDQADLDVLAQRTEGWAVGLQLAAISMQGRADIHGFIQDFTGSHHYIVEYLTEEILCNQTEALQRFLLCTSILDRLSVPLCAAVTGITASQALLRQMQRDNLFLIPLDETQEWYRYHQLFADLLRARLENTATPTELNDLHRRASFWYKENNFPEEAVRHAFAAQDFESAAFIIEASARSLLAQGQLATLLRWTGELPEEMLASHLQLQVLHAWALFLNGQSDPALQMLLDAKARLQAMPESSGNRALLGEIATMLATIASLGHDSEKIIALAEQALDHLPESDLVSRARAYRALGGAYGNRGDMERFTQVCEQARDIALQAESPFLAASIMELLATAQMVRGRLRQSAQTYQELIDLGGERASTTFPPAGIGYAGLAGIFLEWNDLETAQRYLDEGVRTSRRGGIGYNLVHVYCTKARLLNALGRSNEAQEALQLAEQVYLRDRSLPAGVILSTHQVRHWLDRGELGIAHRWARGETISGEQVFEMDNLPVILGELRLVSLAHVYLAERRLEDVLSLAEGVCDQALVGDRLARVIEMRLLEALALHALGRTSKALAVLAASLLLAEPGGYMRLYLEMGSSAYILLEALYREPSLDTILLDYLTRILEAFTLGGRHAQPLVEPLTGRELEVLGLISRGFSNQQIAAQLVITLHTVKKHTSNIYGKLGVSSRTQAVARGQELRLV